MGIMMIEILVNSFINLERVDILIQCLPFRSMLCLSINSDHVLCSSVKFYSLIPRSTMLAKFIHRYFIVFMTIVNGPPLLPLSFLPGCFCIEWSLICSGSPPTREPASQSLAQRMWRTHASNGFGSFPDKAQSFTISAFSLGCSGKQI